MSDIKNLDDYANYKFIKISDYIFILLFMFKMMINILRAKLVNDEAALLMKINKNKNIAKMNAKEGMIQKFLEQVFYFTESIGYLFVFNACLVDLII